MSNNTFLGNYPVPNPIPQSYLAKLEERPNIFVIGKAIEDRLSSFGMTVEDVLDPDKMYSILTPREFITFYNVCDLSIPGYGILFDLLGTDFLPFNKYTLIGQKERAPTETSAKYLDQLRYGTYANDVLESIGFQLGYSIEKLPEQLAFKLVAVNKDTFVCIITEAEPQSRERHVYNVCETACNKLYEIYGLRWVAKTKVFSELVRLSQLSALNRNS